MKFSHNWLQSFFSEKLPQPEKLTEVLTLHSFEIEDFEKNGADYVLDIDILPNRAHDCFCHKGIAREIATIFDKKFIDREVGLINETKNESDLKIKIDNSKLCPRYMGRRVENIIVKNSPDWLKQKLEVLGERSINNVVDITNYIMLDLGQPMHAFDADKVKGDIHVRQAKKDEKIILLTGEEAVLDESVLLIADEAGPLAIAGIKGGKRAEVTEATKNIILESANFNPSMVRKTSQKLSIKNNSSKRYENEISPEMTEPAMNVATKLILENASGEKTKNHGVVDIYPQKTGSYDILLSLIQLNNLLGVNFSEKEVENILKRTGWVWKNESGKFTVAAPAERLDLRIKEDLIEEIGRIYGYENIKPTLPENILKKPEINKNFVTAKKIRLALVNLGFSEVYNYAFRSKGEIEIANPIATDKAFLRNNLTDGLREAMEMNMRNAPLLGLDEIKIFEIGTVFGKSGLPTGQVGEQINVAWGTKNKKEIKIEECGLEKAAEKIVTKESDISDLPQTKDIKFKPFSSYPFILRDIAVWTTKGAEEKEVLEIILKNAGELLVHKKLFDKFEKDGRVSYAFNMVFQSEEKTLTDSEINKIMEKITTALNAKGGWQVR